MALTKLTNLVNPEVMADMISATLPKKIKFSKIAKIDDTLEGVSGDTITVPKFGYIGDADDVPEGTPIDIAQLSTTTTQATIKKAGKGVEISDEAVLSGHGNPISEGGAQLTKSIASKIDNDCYAELCKATAVYDGTAAKISYAGIVGANALIADENDDVINKILFIHPDQEATLRLDSDFIDKSKSGMDVIMTGTIGMISGCQVVKSKRVAKVGYLKAESTTANAVKIVAEDATPSSGEAKLSTLTAGAFWDATNKVLFTPAVDDYVVAVAVPYFMNPIVVVDEKDPNEEPAADGFDVDTPALTIYLKRDILAESDRDITLKTTVITADEHYVAVLTNDSKAVLAKIKA